MNTEITKDKAISFQLLTLIADGKTIKEAFAIVLPAVNYDAWVGEVYDALRAKAGKN